MEKTRLGILAFLSFCLSALVWIPLTVTVLQKYNQDTDLISPFVSDQSNKPKPLLQFTIPNLTHYPYQTSQLTLEEKLSEGDGYTAYSFSYVTMGKRMTGQATIPKLDSYKPLPVIVMVRGYVEPSVYSTGVGTKNAAAQFAKAGYVTLAPDFFGFGGSDPEPEDSWEARFIKPIVVIELIKSIQTKKAEYFELSTSLMNSPQSRTAQNIQFDASKIGMWGHSNGGQIALSVLEVLQQPLPTTLWAPVTAPFPYSIMFFSDEVEDEGKNMRAWVSLFEKDYDVFEFSLTKHLDRLAGPLQLHHGTADEAALISWSNEFVEKLKAENLRRQEKADLASASATATPPLIELNYFTYPGADHNLQPGWATVVERDLDFFAKELKN